MNIEAQKSMLMEKGAGVDAAQNSVDNAKTTQEQMSAGLEMMNATQMLTMAYDSVTKGNKAVADAAKKAINAAG